MTPAEEDKDRKPKAATSPKGSEQPDPEAKTKPKDADPVYLRGGRPPSAVDRKTIPCMYHFSQRRMDADVGAIVSPAMIRRHPICNRGGKG